MRLHVRWVVASASVLVIALSTASAQQPSRITRTIARDAVYHVAGYDVFSPQVATVWGGVVAQADTIYWEGAPAINVSLALALDAPAGEGLHVDIDGTTLFYPIDYDSLIPMALFIESGGTGLYTAFSDTSLGREFLELAGTLPTSFDESRRVAFEFVGTQYEQALNQMDFCRHCLGVQRSDLAGAANAALERRSGVTSWPENRAYYSYLVTDVGFDALANLERDRLELASGVGRYYWNQSEGANGGWKLRIDSVLTVDRPDPRIEYSERIANAETRLGDLQASRDDAHKRLNELADGEFAFRLGEIAGDADQLGWFDERGQVVDALLALAEEVRTTLDEAEKNPELINETVEEIGRLREAKLLSGGFFLFETLALLRAARRADATAFADFLESLRRDDLVMERTAVWDLYTASFCRAYPAEPECEEG